MIFYTSAETRANGGTLTPEAYEYSPELFVPLELSDGSEIELTFFPNGSLKSVNLVDSNVNFNPVLEIKHDTVKIKFSDTKAGEELVQNLEFELAFYKKVIIYRDKELALHSILLIKDTCEEDTKLQISPEYSFIFIGKTSERDKFDSDSWDGESLVFGDNYLVLPTGADSYYPLTIILKSNPPLEESLPVIWKGFLEGSPLTLELWDGSVLETWDTKKTLVEIRGNSGHDSTKVIFLVEEITS